MRINLAFHVVTVGFADVQEPLREDCHWLPYAALVAGFNVVTIVAMMGILGREGIGPLAGVMNNKNVQYEEE